jgi:hypothetical protein
LPLSNVLTTAPTTLRPDAMGDVGSDKFSVPPASRTISLSTNLDEPSTILRKMVQQQLPTALVAKPALKSEANPTLVRLQQVPQPHSLLRCRPNRPRSFQHCLRQMFTAVTTALVPASAAMGRATSAPSSSHFPLPQSLFLPDQTADEPFNVVSVKWSTSSSNHTCSNVRSNEWSDANFY